MKFFSNKNIISLIKKKPVYFPFIFFKIIKAFFYRKINLFSYLKKNREIIRKIKNLNLSSNSINFSNCNRWKSEFEDKEFSISNWSSSRNSKLRDFYLDLIDSNRIPVAPKDKEEYWSALQLNWLFHEVRSNKTKSEDAELIIKQACQFMSANDDNWIYRQFTISEMITNIVKIQLYFGNELNLGCDVKNFLKKGTFYILNNLEIYSFSNKTSLNHTNNHILSNVRALFWGTKIFNNQDLYEVAIYIYRKHCIGLFDDGVLDEGSTIYHFIAAQCLYDISFFLDLKELPRVDRLISCMNKNNFLMPSTFPVIGDVSPDPSLGSVIKDALKIANALFKANNETEVNNDSKESSKSSFVKYKISDYEIINKGKWSIFLHSRKKDKHIQHSHNDYGSPVLNYGERNIILDLGRPTYSRNNVSDDYTSTKLHSVPQINDLDQNPRLYRDIYPYYFLTPIEINEPFTGNFQFDNKEYTNLHEKNFQLFPNLLYGGSWNRSFFLNNKNHHLIYIVDHLNVNFKKEVTFRFFVPQTVINSKNISFKFYKNDNIVEYKISETLCNDSYGEVNKAYLFEIYSESSLNHKLVTKIEINNE